MDSSAADDANSIWYVSYGSNMSLQRLGYYLAGGRPPDGALTYPGCRDPSPPARSIPMWLPGEVYFALESNAWTGGMAFYDPDEPGRIPARAHLLTLSQFWDIAAQELDAQPGQDLSLEPVLREGRATYGDGCYSSVLFLGEQQGHPVLTFTAPWRCHDVAWRAPSVAYLRRITFGLMEGHDWDLDRSASYWSQRPGAAGHWPAERIAALMRPGAPG